MAVISTVGGSSHLTASIASGSITRPFTVVGWIRPASTPDTDRYPIRLGPAGSGAWDAYWIVQEQSRFEMWCGEGGTSAGWVTPYGEVTNGVWAQLAGVVRSTTYRRCYINGLQDTGSSLGKSTPNPVQLSIFSMNTGTPWSGEMAWWGIWNSELTTTELAYLRNSGCMPWEVHPETLHSAYSLEGSFLGLDGSGLGYEPSVWGSGTLSESAGNMQQIKGLSPPVNFSGTYQSTMNDPNLIPRYVPVNQLSLSSSVIKAATLFDPLLTEDFYGIDRPSLYGKNTMGAMQYRRALRDTVIVYGGSPASVRLEDNMRVTLIVPHVGGSEITISCRVYREADYAGDLPQMIIKQRGQADRVTTDVGAVTTFNLLTDTFTPAEFPKHVEVQLVNRNTATTGYYSVNYDDITVT